MASDGGDPSLTATATVTVDIYRNLNTPQFQNTNSYDVTIAFDSPATVLAQQGTIVATDADTPNWV